MSDSCHTIALDVDGVLLDWAAGFDAWLHTVGVEPAFPLIKARYFDFCDGLGHIPYEDRLTLIGRFNTDPAMGNLPLIPGALEAVQRLRNHGLRLVAVTAPGNDPATIRFRQAQLEIFALDEIEILPLNANKTEALLRHSACALIDDSPKKIAEAEAILGTAFVYTWPYNLNYRICQTRRLFSWNTCLPKILDHFR